MPQHHVGHEIGSQVHVVERLRHEAVDVDSHVTALLPGQVRNLRHGIAPLQCDQQLVQRRLGAVAAQHEVDLRVPDQLFVEVGRRETAHDDGHAGMLLLADLRDLERAVGMRQPVQVDTDCPWPQAREEARHVEATIVHHAQREIDDAHVETPVVQVARHGQESERVHLEHGRRRHHVADGPVEDRTLAEVVHARRVQQQQVRLFAPSSVPHHGGLSPPSPAPGTAAARRCAGARCHALPARTAESR